MPSVSVENESALGALGRNTNKFRLDGIVRPTTQNSRAPFPSPFFCFSSLIAPRGAYANPFAYSSLDPALRSSPPLLV